MRLVLLARLGYVYLTATDRIGKIHMTPAEKVTPLTRIDMVAREWRNYTIHHTPHTGLWPAYSPTLLRPRFHTRPQRPHL